MFQIRKYKVVSTEVHVGEGLGTHFTPYKGSYEVCVRRRDGNKALVKGNFSVWYGAFGWSYYSREDSDITAELASVIGKAVLDRVLERAELERKLKVSREDATRKSHSDNIFKLEVLNAI